MGLLEVGYHYLILPDGRLVECRPHTVQGSHMRGKANEDSIGVCVAGGLSDAGEPEDNFQPAQWDTLRWLYGHLQEYYGPLLLEGHSERRPDHTRQCPAVDMEKVRKWVNSSAD
jgi:N-acetyl-anhydromuramyl-L-alanine amidase AmpD